MKGFAGFSIARERLVPVPDAFFTELLPQIDNLCELKVTLHLFWLLFHRQGLPKAIARSELESDLDLLRSLKTVRGPRPAHDYLREGLERALARGTLLSLSVCELGGKVERWYFLNTPASREALGRVEGGGQAVEEMLPVHRVEVVRLQRPTIFTLYEQNIGPLTPLVADELRDAEMEYPPQWIEAAIRQAVEYNKRNWRYVAGILRRWQTEGRGDGVDSRRSEQAGDPDRYRRGKYGRFVE
ncbi:MAG TPA: DnaD domain protein [Chloroflexota bacterium]|nr:DnaD domain protein [Chloroflexota bacterium]